MFLTPWVLYFLYESDHHFQIWQTKGKCLYLCIHRLWKCKSSIYFPQGRWLHLCKRVKGDVIGHRNPHCLRHGHLWFHTPPSGYQEPEKHLKERSTFSVNSWQKKWERKKLSEDARCSTLLQPSSVLGGLCSPCCPGSLRYFCLDCVTAERDCGNLWPSLGGMILTWWSSPLPWGAAPLPVLVVTSKQRGHAAKPLK